MSISHILQSGLAEARDSGAKQVELHHLPEGGADELANETLAFLRGRPGRPSSISGWTALSPSRAGIMRWWADEAGLTTEAQRRSLRTLRRQTYDVLDERGLIAKPVGPSAVVDVSPAPATAAGTDGVGAWVLRLDPTVWDLARFIADGHRAVSTWAVEDNEQSAAMAHGQRAFLWAGGDGTLIMPGVWGIGWVSGPCEWKSVADGYWVDPAGNSQHMLFADVSIQLLPHPVGLQQVANESRLAGIEVLRDPFGSNPSRLTPEEAAAMVALVGRHPAVPARGDPPSVPTSRRRSVQPPVPGRWVRMCTAPGCPRCSSGSAASVPQPSASAPW
jgi:hypothetical protein